MLCAVFFGWAASEARRCGGGDGETRFAKGLSSDDSEAEDLRFRVRDGYRFAGSSRSVEGILVLIESRLASRAGAIILDCAGLELGRWDSRVRPDRIARSMGLIAGVSGAFEVDFGAKDPSKLSERKFSGPGDCSMCSHEVQSSAERSYGLGERPGEIGDMGLPVDSEAKSWLKSWLNPSAGPKREYSGENVLQTVSIQVERNQA